jgi:membrane fusion protein (multidrug efflux system)
VLAAAASVAVGCSPAARRELPPLEVPVAEVVQRDTPLTFELVAQLRGMVDVDVRARVAGYVTSVDFPEGTEVRKGQLLFTLDDRPFQAKVAEQEGALARAEAALARADEDVRMYGPLAARKAVSQRELLNAVASQKEARAAVGMARAALEEARIDLGFTRIAAPLAGLAGRAQVKVGDLVGPASPVPLTVLSAVDPIRASVYIREADFLRFERARRARITAGGPATEDRDARLVLSDGSAYPPRGKAILMDRAVDPATGALRVDFAFPNPDRLLRPGGYARLFAEHEVVRGALLVPQPAVTELQSQYTVTVIGPEDKAEIRAVKVGPKVGPDWIVEAGLRPGERVAVAGSEKLRDGAKVKPVPAGRK